MRLETLLDRAATRRWLLASAAVVLLFGAAMLRAMSTMSDHGASLTDFEFAGTVDRAKEILDGWNDPGRNAAWTQLALDAPFLLGYGLFLAGACTAVAKRARREGRTQLARIVGPAAWCGLAAAACDLTQNIALAASLIGPVAQPWPRIAQLGGVAILTLVAIALVAALGGSVAAQARARANA